MNSKISVGEMRIIAQARILDKLHYIKSNSYQEILSYTIYSINELLKEYGFNELIARRGGKNRAFIFHKPTRRIIFELGITKDAELFFVNLKGIVNDKREFTSLIDDITKLGVRKQKERK